MIVSVFNSKKRCTAAALTLALVVGLMQIRTSLADSVLVCQIEPHTHTDACYERVMICEKDEGGHIHGEECYETVTVLLCEEQERQEDPGHTHSEACFNEAGDLICGQEEREADPGHVHTEACYGLEQKLTCELEEGHRHSESCWQITETLICGKEEHIHDASCYSDHSADVEDYGKWNTMFTGIELTGEWNRDLLAIARTQEGVRESQKNFIYDAEGNKQGYIRYSHWRYNNFYSPWCAAFVSFCLHYAGVDEDFFPLDEICNRWANTLKEKGLYEAVTWRVEENGEVVSEVSNGYVPIPGDLVFFDYENNGCANHVGILLGDGDEENSIIVIEGNYGNAVRIVTHLSDEKTVTGFGNLREAQRRYELFRQKVEHLEQKKVPQSSTDPTAESPMPNGPELSFEKNGKEINTAPFLSDEATTASLEPEMAEMPTPPDTPDEEAEADTEKPPSGQPEDTEQELEDKMPKLSITFTITAPEEFG